MDDGEVTYEPPSSEEEKNIPFSEMFREVFPYYMAIGMSYDEFWNQDPYLAVYYWKMHELKRDEENQKQWWNGMYTFIAISTALSNIHMDGKKHKINHYLNEPLRIRPYTEEELKAIEDRNNALVVARLNALKAAFDAKENEEQPNAG